MNLVTIQLQRFRGWAFFVDVMIGLGLTMYSVIMFFPLAMLDQKHVFSAPVIPLLAISTSMLTPFSYERAVQAWVFGLFCLFSAGVYVFMWRLTRRRLVGLVAGVLAVVPWFAGGRVEAAFALGDAAHVAAMTFMPVGAMFLIEFLRRGGIGRAALASLSFALVALTSPFGMFVYLIFMIVVTFSEVLLSSGRLKLLRLVAVLVLGSLMAQFWYTLGFLRLVLTSADGREMLRTVGNLIPLSFFLAPVLGVFGFLLFEKRARLQPLFIAAGLVIIFWLFSFAGGLSEGLYISHQSRYVSDLSMALAFMVGLLAVGLFDVLKNLEPLTRRWRRAPIAAFTMGLMAVLVIGVVSNRSQVNDVLRVLGATTGLFPDDIVGIGEIRRQTSAIDKMVGSMVSAATFGGLTWASIRFGQKSRENKNTKRQEDRKTKSLKNEKLMRM